VIRFFGDGLLEPLHQGSSLIALMSNDAIQHDYVLYVGVGAVATGGIISMFQALPLILNSIRSAFGEMRGERGGRGGLRRTDRDMPLWVVGGGAILLVIAILATTALHRVVSWISQLDMNWWGAALIA